MNGWNSDALQAVAAIRAQVLEISEEEDRVLKEALAAIENDGKARYTKTQRARAHEAIASVERLLGPRCRQDVDRLKAAFALTLGPEVPVGG